MKNSNSQPIKTRQDLYDAIGDVLLDINVNAGITFGIAMIAILTFFIIVKLTIFR